MINDNQKYFDRMHVLIDALVLALSYVLSWYCYVRLGVMNNHPERGILPPATYMMALVPQVADAVKIPVIAAGGIADGRGMAAAFMLGAEAVQMGTRFVASKEAVVHENYKQLVIKAKDIDTRVTGRTTGHPVRAIRNEMTRHYLELEKEGAPFEELEKLTLGGLRRAVVDGDVKTGSVMSGQIAGMVKDEKSCKEIIEQMMNEMEELLKGAPARL